MEKVTFTNKIANRFLCRIAFVAILIVPMLIGIQPAYSQSGGVGINATNAPANAHAMLDVQDTTRGVLLTPMTAAQAGSISTSGLPVGLTVFVTNAGSSPFTAIGYYYWNGSAWQTIGNGNGTVTSVGASSPLSSSGGATPVISFSSQSANTVLAAPNGSSGAPAFRALVAADIPGGGNNWSVTGNGSTTPGTNFIGTTDSTDFVIKTKNIENFRSYASGKMIAMGIGAGPTPATTSNVASLVLRGANGNMQMNVQDGGARGALLWNATGSVGTYETSAEPAAYIGLADNGTTGTDIDFFSAAGGTAGNTITWTQLGRLSGSNQVWLSPRGTSTDFYIDASGEIGLGTSTPGSQLNIGGTYTTANSNRATFSGTLASSGTASQNIINVQMNFSPTGASLINVIGGTFNPIMTGSSLGITSMYGIYARTDLNSGFTGSVTNGIDIAGDNPSLGSGQYFPAFTQFYGAALTNGNGITTGTVNNRGVLIQSATAAAASGGTVNNYGGLLNLATGSGAGTTNNYGLYINGNGGSGGSGTTSNWSLYNNSTANSYFAGGVGIGTNTLVSPFTVASNSANTTSNYVITTIEGTQTTANTGNYYGMNIANNYTATSGNTLNAIYGIQTNPRNSSTGTISNAIGVVGLPQNTSTGSITTLIGIQGIPQNAGSGAVTGLYGVQGVPQNTNAGTVTSAFGIYGRIDNTNASGVITNAYGLYIADPTVTGAITNKYAIITTANAGNVGIGTATPISTAQVAGNLTVGSGSSASSTNNVQITTNGSSPTVSRLAFGTDGTGYKFALSKNQSATVSDLMTIQDNGNVGINQTSPAAKLEVDGSSGSTFKMVDGNQAAGKVLISDANGQASWSAITGISGGVTNSCATTNAIPRMTGSNTMGCGILSDNGTKITNSGTSADLILQLSNTNTSAYMADANNGNNGTTSVGGTTTGKASVSYGAGGYFAYGSELSTSTSPAIPASGQFGVIGVANASSGANTAGEFIASNAATTNIGGYFDAEGGTSNYAITTGNGNVGIGTSTPSNLLSVGSSSQFQVSSLGAIAAATGITSSGSINFSGLTASLGVYTDGSKNLTSTVPTSGQLGYWTRSSTNLYNTNQSDNVGIGTSSPGAILDITSSTVPTLQLTNTNTGNTGKFQFREFQDAGGFQITSNYNNTSTGGYSATGALYDAGRDGLQFVGQCGSNGSGTTNFFDFGIASSTTATSIMRIQANGDVGINCTSPNYALQVVGSIAASGTLFASSATVSTSFTACSDIRYKKDITPLPNALDNVLKLQGVNYYWKKDEFPDKYFNDKKQIGIIAQEVEKIYPELVFTDADGYKSVDYSRFTPILIEAIKEQQQMIDNLKSDKENSDCSIEGLQMDNKNLQFEIGKLQSDITEIKNMLSTGGAGTTASVKK